MARHHKSATAIAALNDELRRTGTGGSRYITAGVHAQGPEFLVRVIGEVAAFDRFDADNDPYGEHDFGCVTVLGHKVFWKIDYYDPSLEAGSEDPADPAPRYFKWVASDRACRPGCRP
jgi:hypothetical protein